MKAAVHFGAIVGLIVSIFIAGETRADAEFTTIQAAINAAQPGDIVSIPSGTYTGSIVITDGVMLCGEGAETTIIDGDGAETVVSCGKDSAIIGVTIQNGTTGVFNAGNFIGVSDCIIKDMSTTCIRLAQGSALITRNLLKGSGDDSFGVFSRQSNPIVSSNVVVNHQWAGILNAHKHVLTLSDNVIAGNNIGLCCRDDGAAILDGNIFDRNDQHLKGIEWSDSDTTNRVDLTHAIPYRQPPPREEIRAEMDRAYQVVVAEHPSVIYTLSEALGTFNMATLYPWATFTVAASANDTAIDAYAAHDLVALTEIDASCHTSPTPRLIVKNDALVEKELDRYALTSTYVHPESYTTNATGQLVFNRLTNFSNISVVGPAGYRVASVSHPHTASTAEGRTTVTIVDIGHTAIKLVMAPRAHDQALLPATSQDADVERLPTE
ncbi:MAG: DUF1565 domain-containing protein [Verrucomicrobia bacterium]|jgi:hypothetical protein|nr:DUF1565 domain-containing protein [Verrucomicrobiota bacterium]MBT7068136.1 DUF1565 domain-containing protein [Verrucomicrobiota bacterium]MBT7700812.1 DUF1565 domain-containing protein [Verrucomicrobiota bacterium]